MPSWTAPTVEQVAAWVPSRTNDDFNNRQNTFNENTQPTGTQAASLIDMAKSHIEAQVGSDLCDAIVQSKPQGVTALYAAMLIELTYFPEQIRANQSPYPELKNLYDSQLEQLRSDVSEECGDVPGSEPGAEAGGGAQSPEWDFDVSTVPLGRELPW